MGIYDRDYIRESPRGSFASLSMLSVTTWLIIINVVVFLLDQMLTVPGTQETALEFYRQYGDTNLAVQLTLMSPLKRFGHFSMFFAVQHGQIWRFFTFQFLHANFGHLLGNMLSLYFFGQMVEAYLSPRRYLVFYLLCGVAGAAMYLLMAAAHIMIYQPWVPLVGASAGIFGILIAAASVAPNVTVMMMFPPIPMQLRTFAWVMLGIAAYTVFSNGQNAGGQAAHLGGAALGYVLIRFPMSLDWVVPKRRVQRVSVRRADKDWTKDSNR